MATLPVSDATAVGPSTSHFRSPRLRTTSPRSTVHATNAAQIHLDPAGATAPAPARRREKDSRREQVAVRGFAGGRARRAAVVEEEEEGVAVRDKATAVAHARQDR